MVRIIIVESSSLAARAISRNSYLLKTYVVTYPCIIAEIACMRYLHSGKNFSTTDEDKFQSERKYAGRHCIAIQVVVAVAVAVVVASHCPTTPVIHAYEMPT